MLSHAASCEFFCGVNSEDVFLATRVFVATGDLVLLLGRLLIEICSGFCETYLLDKNIPVPERIALNRRSRDLEAVGLDVQIACCEFSLGA